MKAGLYVHVPFCRHRCHFCAFLITTHRDFLDRWADGTVTEIERRAAEFDLPFDTVYFGGGTPSLAPPAAIGKVLDAARAHLAVTDDAEVTLEANPDDVTADDLAELRRRGVNRLSLGLQSLDDADLSYLTRTHTAEQGAAAFRAARAAGFDRITVDLLYGLPERTVTRWREVLHEAVALGPEHVCAYQLTWEPGTPFRRLRDKGEMRALSEAEERERFLLTRQWLADAGYEQYEVSNFARAPEMESRHNKKYWEGAPYLGVGPAAHSYREPERWWNAGAVRNWVRAIELGRSAVDGRETLGPEERRLERLMLGLRTKNGVALADVRDGAVADRLVAEGMAVVEGERYRLTPEGLAVADRVAAELS